MRRANFTVGVGLRTRLGYAQAERPRFSSDRLADPTKRWKFNPADLPERAKWDDYMAAFEDAMVATGTEEAPWHVIPANRKWYRDIVLAETLVDTLEKINPQCPEPSYDWRNVVIE